MFRKLLYVIPVSLFFMILLSGCGKTGSLDEGDCKLTVSFVDIPRELSMLEDNIKDNLSVEVTLININNEKRYNIILNEQNSYEKQVSLHPGVYRVSSPFISTAFTQMSMAADVKDIKLSAETPSVIHVYVDNPDEFTRHWMSIQPMPEMLLAEKFDGIIQVNRQIIDLRSANASSLLSQLDLTYDNNVPAYRKVELTDYEMGISVTMQNESGEPASWQSCTLTGIYVFRNNVVFPQGVTLGMAPETVCHRTEGLYGEPDSLSGSLLYGWNMSDTYVIYNDDSSGDKITLTLDASGETIQSIRYELAQFE